MALLYTHHWGVFVVAGQVAAVVLRVVHHRPPVKHLIFLFLLIVCAYIPGLVILRHQDVSTPAGVWFWVVKPDLATVYHVCTAYAGTYFAMATAVFSLPAVFRITGAAALVILVLMGVLRSARPDPMRYYLFLFIVTPGVPFILAFFKPEIFLWYRYTVIPLPLLFIAAAGIVSYHADNATGPPGAKRFVLPLLTSGPAVACIIVLICCGVAGTYTYFHWEKSNVRSVAEYADSVTHRYRVLALIRPGNIAPNLHYYYHGSVPEYDEAYLNTPLGNVIDTIGSFTYISLDVPNEIRDYFDAHFDRIVERTFPGEAHMGLVVGVYRRRE